MLQLYCLNDQCNVSVFHQMKPVEVVFNAENITAVHICIRCGHQMSSGIDLLIEQVIAEAGIEITS